jgi:ribonuclease G
VPSGRLSLAEHMAQNILVINVDLRETRVALIENGVIAELQIERATSRGSVGNIVLGKVTRVLPGMQAAFIDVGMERAAFLHVEDLIRPDDFEAYLASGASGARSDEDGEEPIRGENGRRADYGGRPVAEDEPAGAAGHGDEDDEDDEPDDGDDSTDVAASSKAGPAEDAAESDTDGDEDEREGDQSEADEDVDDPELESGPGHAAGEEEEEDEDDEVEEDDSDEGDLAAASSGEGDGETGDAPVSAAGGEGAEGLAVATSTPSAGEAKDDLELRQVPGGGRRRRRRRRRRGAGPGSAAAPSQDARGREPRNGGRDSGRNGARASRTGGRDGKNRDARGGRRKDARISRSVPITEVVKEGDEVIVQISKEPIGTKGARVTSHVSLPGRHVVYLPTVEHIGVSKRIGSPRERARLREVIDSIKPPKGGLIVRTVAEGLTKKGLKTDIGYLVKVWEEVSKRREGAKAPAVLYTELDLVLKVARDLFTDEIQKIVIDDREQYGRLVRFVEMFMPERAEDIELYTGDEPIFDAYGIEDEIGRALSRKVPLPSGGYLIIDQAEALTAIDVNTGRFVGKGSRDLEETALKTNLEAVEEIAYQLRFRNIGGLVILDLIDMDRHANREQVWRALEQRLARDKAKTTLNRISELGLIEMTRKRTRESLGRVLHEPCFYCDGTGQIQSRATIAYEILRQIRRDRAQLPGYSVVVNAHPAVIDLMQTEEKQAVEEAARRFQRRIILNAKPEYHIEQFDLQGK